MKDTHSTETERQIGQRISQHLNAATQVPLSPHIQKRLMAARQNALKHQRAVLPALSLVGLGHHVSYWGRSLWRPALVLLLLAGVGVGYNHWRTVQRAAELEELDSALLSSDLPIDAYTDHGFNLWLNNSD